MIFQVSHHVDFGIDVVLTVFVYSIYVRAGLLGQPFLNVANSTMRS